VLRHPGVVLCGRVVPPVDGLNVDCALVVALPGDEAPLEVVAAEGPVGALPGEVLGPDVTGPDDAEGPGDTEGRVVTRPDVTLGPNVVEPGDTGGPDTVVAPLDNAEIV